MTTERLNFREEEEEEEEQQQQQKTIKNLLLRGHMGMTLKLCIHVYAIGFNINCVLYYCCRCALL